MPSIAVVAATLFAASPYGSPIPLPTPVPFAPGIVSTGLSDGPPTFSPDGRNLYFLRNSPDGRYWTVVVSAFRDGRWQPPEVAPFSGRYNDADPTFSRDGRTLWLASNRPAHGRAHSDTDIFVAHRTGDAWGEFARVDAVSSPADEYFPIVADSGTIYFASERDGGKGGTDVWRARRVGDGYAPPENLTALNTRGNEIEALAAPDESYVILASDGRPDTRGKYDLYVSWQCDGQWGEPRNLGDGINSDAKDYAPKLSPDGRYLFFTSNRSTFGEPAGRTLTTAELARRLDAPGNGLNDVYQVDVDALQLVSPCPR
ncbi:MAG TPA: hypothetical protein VJ724_13365 [Tahibacter sp.]|nr:hypothetical protein [Tahibacter sp.]